MSTDTLTEKLPTRHTSSNLSELVRIVDRQTQQRVEGLSIRQIEGELIVTGRSPNYYVKQLVTLAIRTSAPAARLLNEICVG